MIARIVLFLVILQSLAPGANEFPPKGFTELSTLVSPYGSFSVMHFKQDPDDFSSDSQIWIHALKPDFQDQLIFTHNNRSAALISDDENYIAINHHELSGLGNFIVFKRNEKGGFDKVDKDFLALAKDMAIKKLKLEHDALEFDHEYCYADTWMRDGLLLGHVRGDLSGEAWLKEWYFIYDAKHDVFTWDLAKLNKGTYLEKSEHPEPVAYESLRAWHAHGGLDGYSWPKEQKVDLNGDGKDEVFLGVMGFSRGMVYALFAERKGKWIKLSEDIEGSHLPFERLEGVKRSWHEFRALQPNGRGGLTETIYTWKRKKYIEKSSREISAEELHGDEKDIESDQAVPSDSDKPGD